jgi:hypothetical protein
MKMIKIPLGQRRMNKRQRTKGALVKKRRKTAEERGGGGRRLIKSQRRKGILYVRRPPQFIHYVRQATRRDEKLRR